MNDAAGRQAVGLADFSTSKKTRWFQAKFQCDHLPNGIISCCTKTS